MRRILLLLSVAHCLFASAALAGPMPQLPELPPLPTDYVPVTDADYGPDLRGSYAGVLAGGAWNPGLRGTIGVVIGHNFGDSFLFGVEAMALATTSGEVSVEAAGRAGAELDDGIGLFGSLGLGTSSHTGAFVTTGVSLEAAIAEGWDLRAQYRYAHDLSGDPHGHSLLAGLITRF